MPGAGSQGGECRRPMQHVPVLAGGNDAAVSTGNGQLHHARQVKVRDIVGSERIGNSQLAQQIEVGALPHDVDAQYVQHVQRVLQPGAVCQTAGEDGDVS